MENPTYDAAAVAAAYRNIAKMAQDRRPTIPLEMPSGAIWHVRRPRIETWIIGGRLPQHLVMVAIQAARTKEVDQGILEGLAKEVSDADQVKILCFARDLVKDAVAAPQIVVAGSDGLVYDDPLDPQKGRQMRPEEISADEVFADDFWFAFEWAAKAARGIPIATGKGATTLEAVETFRPGEVGGSSSDAGASGGNGGAPGVGSVHGGDTGRHNSRGL